jgi:hypothetical protein
MGKKPESSVRLEEPLLATMVYLKECFQVCLEGNVYQ